MILSTQVVLGHNIHQIVSENKVQRPSAAHVITLLANDDFVVL